MKLDEWTRLRRRELQRFCAVLLCEAPTSTTRSRLLRRLSQLEDELNSLSFEFPLDLEIPDETR